MTEVLDFSNLYAYLQRIGFEGEMDVGVFDVCDEIDRGLFLCRFVGGVQLWRTDRTDGGVAPGNATGVGGWEGVSSIGTA